MRRTYSLVRKYKIRILYSFIHYYFKNTDSICDGLIILVSTLFTSTDILSLSFTIFSIRFQTVYVSILIIVEMTTFFGTILLSSFVFWFIVRGSGLFLVLWFDHLVKETVTIQFLITI